MDGEGGEEDVRAPGRAARRVRTTTDTNKRVSSRLLLFSRAPWTTSRTGTTCCATTRSSGCRRALMDLGGNSETSLQLSTNTLQQFKNVDSRDDSAVPSGRRQTMVLKGADLIVAAGQEIRMTTLGETHLNQNEGKKVFKVRATEVRYGVVLTKPQQTLHCPNVQFNIHQIALNPSGKLLAVAGAFQVAVIVLPRSGFMRLVPNVIDCKCVLGASHRPKMFMRMQVRTDWPILPRLKVCGAYSQGGLASMGRSRFNPHGYDGRREDEVRAQYHTLRGVLMSLLESTMYPSIQKNPCKSCLSSRRRRGACPIWLRTQLNAKSRPSQSAKGMLIGVLSPSMPS